MTLSTYKVERIAFGSILGIALLMFFQPLVRLYGLNGSQVSDALSVQSALSQLQSNLQVLARTDTGVSLVSMVGAHATAKPMVMPFSLRMSSLVHWYIFAALGFCLLALLANFFFKRVLVIFSFLGGCAAAMAVLHVKLMGSDLQSWTEVSMNTALVNSPRDPCGVIMMANSFLVNPGSALYLLTTCLFLVAFLSSTNAVPRLKSVVRTERRVSLSQPVFLRPVNSRFPEENCMSLDVSQSGLLLETSLSHHYVGMEVYLTRNARAGDPANSEEHGSVVRVEKMQNGKSRIGIHIIPEG